MSVHVIYNGTTINVCLIKCELALSVCFLNKAWVLRQPKAELNFA